MSLLRFLLPIAFALASALAPRIAVGQGSYLFVWTGGTGPGASDFMATIDANPASSTYGHVLASVPTGTIGMPHHTEHEMPVDGHLLANDFPAGHTWLFDLTNPVKPWIITSFGDVAGYSHPHSFIRLANGNLLATFQYRADATTKSEMKMGAAGMHGMKDPALHRTGGLVEMDERGKPLLSASAVDTSIKDRFLYPYSVLPMPGIDRAVSTTSDMNLGDTTATSQWIQIWRLSDLKLLRTFALPAGPRGSRGYANEFTGEPRLLPDGHSVYIHTFNCGLYLLQDVGNPKSTASFVHAFNGVDCGVPVVTSHYWIQTVPAMHGLVVLDVTNPEHPREVSRLSVGADEMPHWIAIDPTGKRIVLNSAGAGNRLFVINFDPRTGQLALDVHFRDPGSKKPGIVLTGANWPRGFTGNVVPHGAVFSR
ncbi:MAG: hypothetical protein ABI311_04850 [Gemmatimonadaceae bacterium]